MSLNIECTTPAQSLSPSAGAPSYRTPKVPSRPPPRHAVSSPLVSSSTLPGPADEDRYVRDQDMTNDENISLLDPRRFTPNLHASLVAEILSLRREIESKTTVVETLEQSLHDTKAENGQLNDKLRMQVEEGRSFKRQMHLLETGTLSALGELAKERDGAVANLNDVQKRLEASKNKARAHEEETERTHGLWNRDRQTWDDEKRNMERKIHVVEGRLRTILNEVATAQAGASPQATTGSTEIDHGMRETWFTKSSDSTASNRSTRIIGRSHLSGLSNNAQDGSDAPNFSQETSSGFNGLSTTNLNGLSLAEELECDENGESLEDFDTDGGLASPDALPEEVQMRRRRSSSLSQLQDQKARKVLGLLAESSVGHMQGGITGVQHMEKIEEKPRDSTREPGAQYIDNGTQSSPPLSPKSSVQDTDAPAERNTEQTENTANQRRKRVSIPSTSFEQTPSTKSAASLNMPMVTAGCQTLEVEGPPWTSKDLTGSSATESFWIHGSRETKSSTTQTNDEEISMLMSADIREDSLMTIPTIAIHPPGSRPPSSHTGVVLPPRTKNAASQVSIELPIAVRSVSVQTDEIRSDRRPLKIPPRSISTHVLSKSTSSRHEEVKESIRNQVAPRKSSRRNRPPAETTLPRARAPIRESIDSYPGNNDNGPLNKKQSSDLRRPIRDQSLFAGFESASDEEAPAIPDIGFSDDDFATAPPVRKTLSKVQNSWKLVPRAESTDLGSLGSDQVEEDTNKENEPENVKPRPETVMSKKQRASKPATIKPSARPPNSYHAAREPNIRRTALISSGAAAHTNRARSPGAASAARVPASVAPPFPVPTRSSSRRIPMSASDGALSPTPYSTNFSALRTHEVGRPPSKNAILRKVRSATTVPRIGRNYHTRSRSRSPPSTASIAPESPRLPRLPQHDHSTRRAIHDHRYKDLSSASSLTPPVIEDPAEPLHQSTSVVDAIAQTMVGEWMWKYVRRRKSFGISESPQVEFDISRNNGETGASSGVRHKRWVWLAPYERAIMWSSKQPTSGPALLGKTGRKLAIQSVLDVKDDAPMPKNSGSHPPVHRSILILTPQRALKFTATTIERHYIWLRALSFLSQSSSGMHESGEAPLVPPPEYPPPSRSSNGSRRGPILDSFRTAHSKRRAFFEGNRAHTSPLGVLHAPSVPEVGTTYDEQDILLEAAEAPHVPRMSTHLRKRSSTGPCAGPPSISHTFVNKATMSSSSISLQANLSPDGFSAFQRGNPRISEANTGSSHIIRNNFFDAVGTVRMEAFIDERDTPAPQRRREQKPHRARQGWTKDLSYWGVGGPMSPDVRLQPGNEARWKGEDPFKGF
ncbi:hypothetical protein MMC07_008850 [Pseudocyphellaria aurata]|nr:hypothetical protein [Pseudocyphellaria aurata]